MFPFAFSPIYEELVKSEKDTCYTFYLKDVCIVTHSEWRRETLDYKYAAMREYQPYIQQHCTDESMANENKYVFLGFSVFKKSLTGLIDCIVQPIFSNAIYNMDNLPVPTVINSTGSRFGGTQVCLIILKASKYEWVITIYLPDSNNRPIKHCVVSDKCISVRCCTITFTMPNCVPEVPLHSPSSKALIQMKRNDGAMSAFLDFTFNDNRKKNASSSIDCPPEKRQKEAQEQDENLPRLLVRSDATVVGPPIMFRSEGTESVLWQDPKQKFLRALRQLNDITTLNACSETKMFEYNKDYADDHPDGNTIFHDAIRYSSNGDYFMKLYKMKLAQKCIPKFQNDMQRTLLHYACELNHSTLIRQLVGLECDLDAQDFAGNTPLHLALLKRHHKCTEMFNAIFQSPSDYEHMGEKIKRLLTTYNNMGLTALHLAVMYDEQDLVRSLLEFCRDEKFEASSVQTLENGDTLLHLAVARNLEDMVGMILEYEPFAVDYENYAGCIANQVPLTDDIKNLRLS